MEHQIIAAYAGVAATIVIGLGQLGMIGWGLWQMSQSGKRRDRALDQQGEALNAQTQMLADIGQGLRDQGQGLAELLRRSA